MSTDTMIGRRCPEGKGGRDCPCCGQAPGADRARARRRTKRRERRSWKNEVR